MLRVMMLLLCLVLAAAAAGRYQAEVRVREARRELKAIDAEKQKALTEIQVLKAEIAYLEGPERLAAVAERHTDLRPVSGAQLVTADEFLAMIGARETPRSEPNEGEGDVILHALALADASAMQ